MINTIVNFSSISSDNNLFDFDMMLKRVKTKAGISQAMYVEMVRQYINKKYPEMNPTEQSTVVALFMTAEMTYKHFIESLDAMNMSITMSVDLGGAQPASLEGNPANAGELGKFNRDELIRMSTSIVELDLSVRASGLLKGENIYTFNELCASSKGAIKNIQGLGKTTFEEIESAMKKHGLFFDDDITIPYINRLMKYLPKELEQEFFYANIRTVGDLVSRTTQDLRKVGITDDNINKIRLALSAMNLALAD